MGAQGHGGTARRLGPVPRKLVEAGYAKTEWTILAQILGLVLAVLDHDVEGVGVVRFDSRALWRAVGLNLPLPNYLRKYLAMIFPNADIDVLYYNARSNRAARQMIGMIQLVAGVLNTARKQGKGVRLFIELPETYLHPEQQAHLMSTLQQIMDDYGLKEG